MFFGDLKRAEWSGQADNQLSGSFSFKEFLLYILFPNSGLEEETIFPGSDFVQYLISWCRCVFLTARQALPWGYSLANLATPAYEVRGNADWLVAALVRLRIGDIALTAAVTSAARCVWTCALACVQETAATPSVHSASVWHRAASYFLPPNKVKHQRHSVSLNCSNTDVIQNTMHLPRLS